MNTLIQDIRFGIRMLLKSPGVSIIATIALALGIGANTAIFSVVNTVLLRPLPFPEPDSLVSVFETYQTRGQLRGAHSYPNFFDLRDQGTSFERLAAYRNSDYVLTGKGDPIRINGLVATSDLLPLLKVAPLHGRWFTPEEDKPGEGRVVILSQQIFERRFNSDPAILNQSITLNGRGYTVIGIMPASFHFPVQNEPVEVWSSIADDASGSEPVTTQRGAHFLRAIGRLKPGVTEEQAQAELTTIGARLEQQFPDTNSKHGFFVESSLKSLVGDVRSSLFILLGAVACVLLIACANVANLLLARATSRQKEMAIRAALGARRIRVIRQLLTESIMLSLLGGSIGLLLAVWWADLLVALGKEDIPRAVQVSIDWRVLGFTFGVAVLTGILFGLVPALQSTRTELTESLKDGGRGGSSASKHRTRSLLVVSELAIAVVLLVAAGLLLQSFWRLRNTQTGLDPKNVLTYNVSIPEARYKSDEQVRFFQDLRSRLQGVAGVESASAITPLPLSGSRFGISFQIEGKPVAPKDEPAGDFFSADAGYFKTMGIPVLKGRDFDQRDQHRSTPVVIISEAFAREYFPNEDPIGKRIKPGISTYEDDDTTMREIIGMVGDIRNRNLDVEPKPAFYVPMTQVPFGQMVVVMKTTPEPHSLIPASTREVLAMDKDVPVFQTRTMEEYISASVTSPRFNTTLLGIFAGVALVLTMVGLYGVMSYSVAQRTNEIGIRLALGAQPRDVLSLIVKQGLSIIFVGIAVGLVGAYAATRVMASLLFGVTAKDPATFITVAVVLGLVALLACLIPALRATRVDPLTALRYE